MRAVIPVAGKGTRLRPHTYSLPKVLLNVAGKPILGHILDALQEQGINKTTLITGYMGELVEEYVKKYDMESKFVFQKDRKGLGHAIWMAKDTFGDEPLMIILGDTIFDADLSLAKSSGYSSLAVKEVEDPRRFGVVVTDDDGFVTKMVEKPDEPVSKQALVGIYYIENPKLLVEAMDEMIEKNIKTRGEFQLTDALQIMIDKGEKFKTFNIEGWYDCGKPETLLSTNRFLLNRKNTPQELNDCVIIPPVYIDPTAKVEKSVIGPYATVAEGCKVSESIIKDSILSDGASVRSSLLNESIIGNNASVHGHFHSYNVGSSSELKRL